jgi:hypothetical protein
MFPPECPEGKKAVLIAQNGLFQFNPGGDLRSHTVTRAVSSALRGLTSVFGMGTGVTLAVLPPETFARCGHPDHYGRHAASVTTELAGITGSTRNRTLLCIFWLATSCEAAVCSSPKTVWESFMIKPNGRLVRVSFTHYCASTSRLSKS